MSKQVLNGLTVEWVVREWHRDGTVEEVCRFDCAEKAAYYAIANQFNNVSMVLTPNGEKKNHA